MNWNLTTLAMVIAIASLPASWDTTRETRSSTASVKVEQSSPRQGQTEAGAANRLTTPRYRSDSRPVSRPRR